MITPGFSVTATERVLPRLALDFTTGVLDSRVTVTRALNTATRVNSSGYVETVNANLPRFDYDAVTLLPKGLLIEETRANLLLRSSEFNVSPWTPIGAAITPDTATAPDNTLTADTITFSGAGQYILQNVAITLGVVYTISFYIRTVTGTSNIKLVNDGGASVSSNIPVTNQWTRITFTSTSSRTGSAGHGLESAGASSFYIWGAQLEAGAFATSYIPTTTISLTRNADVVSMTGTNFSSWYNQSEGAIVCSVSGGKNSVWAVSYDMGTTGNLAYVRQTSPTAVSSVINGAGSSAASITAHTAYTTVLAYKINDCAFAINGGQLSTFAGTPGTATDLIIGSLNGSFVLNGHVKKLMFYPQRLTNAECVAFSK